MTAKSPAIIAGATAPDAGRPAWRTKWAERENERRRRAHDADTATWRRRADELSRLRAETSIFHGCTEPRAGLPVELDDDEVVYRVLPAAELVEAEARHIAGLPLPGLTVTPVATDTRQGGLPSGLRTIDAGMAVVTDRRIAFAGRHGSREWWYIDLTGPAHHPEVPLTLLHSVERGKLTGLLVPRSAALNFRFYLTLAFADVIGDRGAVATYLDELVTAHERVRPVPPRPAEPRQAPPTALLHDRRLVAVAAVAVAVLAAAGALGTVEVGGPSPVTAVGAPAREVVADTDASSAVGAASGTRPGAGSTAGLPAPAAGPDGVVAPPQSGQLPPGGPAGAGGKTAGGPAGAVPTSAPQTPGGPAGNEKPERTPRPTPTAAPTTSAPALGDLCGAPENPYGYNYCGGLQIFQPAADVCSYFACIEDFWDGEGYLVRCGDGLVTLLGGRPGACANHGGARSPVYV